MKIVNVIPLSKGIFKETLSYFSSKDMPVGSIVTVEVRNKKIKALVESVENATDIKSKIRTSQYVLKKLENTEVAYFFTPMFIKSAQKCAQYFATTTGEILQSLTSKTITADYIETQKKNLPENIKKKSEQNEIFVFQADNKDRLTTYKSLIREEFAKRSSVFLCLPSSFEIEEVLNTLERGIKEYTFILHNNLSKKELIKSWVNILKEEHPVLIVATGHFLSIPRADMSTIILDKENSNNYKTFIRPFFDIRTFSEIFAKTANLKLIFGDTLLRPETIYRANTGELIELSPLKFRSLSTATQTIVDMKEYKASGSHKSFAIISNELKTIIKNNKKNNENLFILTGRRGLSPVTICNDCGEIVMCKNCNSPMILHKKNRENVFLCHRCGKQENSERKCDNCKSWRLAALGTGIEKIEEEIEKQFPEIKIFKIDSDSTKTHKKAMDIAKKFFSSPGSVLVGTEMSLSYINTKIDNGAVIGMDSLFALPDFRIGEKIFNMLLSVRSQTLKNFLIQTRNTEEKIFEYITNGNMLDFYRSEIKQRKTFGYPPFSTLIKITCQGKKPTVTKEMHKLSKILEKYNPNIYQSFAPTGKHEYSVNALIKLTPGKWIDTELLNILHSLPPFFTIKVDPKDLL